MANPRRSLLEPAFALGCALLVATACQSTEFTYLDIAEPDTASDVGPTDVVPADGDASADAGPTQSLAGGPCAVDGDCFTGGKCFSTDVVKGLLGADKVGDDFEIPNGMCTKFPCAKDDQCGAGGKCVDASALVGMALKLCGWPCEDYSDCRWKEGFVCYYTGQADEIKLCLPTDLVAIIPCGNGTCDPLDNETAATCPRDCQ